MGVIRLQKSLYKKTGDVRWHITIPHEFVEDKGWEKGQRLMATYNKDDELLIKEMPMRKITNE